jgi:uncharacterized protein (DUF2235 family)
MSKNIALFIDGTGCNALKDVDKTNVWKLHEACLEPTEQKMYLAGVGSVRHKVMGGLVGLGTRKNLEDAYNFLVANHNKDGDPIFLFGFSRGALGVRLFADFLGRVGKKFYDPAHRHELYRVYQIYVASELLGAAAAFGDYMAHFGERPRPLPIHFIGAWDTVEEYVYGGPSPDLEELPNHISVARHALALHERRGEMEPTLWKRWDPEFKLPGGLGRRVMQVWFPGAHADVGGGYPTAESGLADASLEWMTREAKACGLHVGDAKPEPGARRVLHQARTKDAWVGAGAELLQHARPRSALSGFLKLDPVKDAQLIDSTFVHRSACGQMLDPIRPPEFVNYPGRSFVGRGAREKAEEDLRKIDGMTLQMFLKLRMSGKGPVE